jgi:hypothetical protein
MGEQESLEFHLVEVAALVVLTASALQEATEMPQQIHLVEVAATVAAQLDKPDNHLPVVMGGQIQVRLEAVQGQLEARFAQQVPSEVVEVVASVDQAVPVEMGQNGIVLMGVVVAAVAKYWLEPEVPMGDYMVAAAVAVEQLQERKA